MLSTVFAVGHGTGNPARTVLLQQTVAFNILNKLINLFDLSVHHSYGGFGAVH